MTETETTPTTPKIKRPAYFVLLVPPAIDPATCTDDQAETVHVVVNAGDQLRAELEAGQIKLPENGRQTPFHITALWLWAALARTGVIDYRFGEFKQRLLAYEPDKQRPAPHGDPETADELDELDPRPTEASTS